MTPSLSALLAAADAAKQTLLIVTNANETAAQLAAQAKARHEECYAAVLKATEELRAARAAIDAALDTDYGLAPKTEMPEWKLPEQPMQAEPGAGEPDPAPAPVPATAEAATDVAIGELETPAA